MDSSISELRENQKRELENLTLATQPFKTLKYFFSAIFQCLGRFIANCGLSVLLVFLAGGLGIFSLTINGAHEELVQELIHYLRFGLWWLALGVASSIGLGSGLHTFVLYLGPHIAMFTIKSMHCGRVDIKSAPYDTTRLNSGPSWLNRNCSEFGPPLFPLQHNSTVPLSSILPQVQLEALLWGIGTALGELPPYFLSRAAHVSGSKMEAMTELDSSPSEDCGIVAKHLNQIKWWLYSQSHRVNFFTILVLASVPNPLFDLAGMMCGQFGIPFWKFFLATLIGKAIIKTHIQTAFIISVCNNQLQNALISVLNLFPGLGSVVPNLGAILINVKDKYLRSSHPAPSETEVKRWDLSLASIWNSFVWLMLMNFVIKIVTQTAQSFLKKEHEMELAALTNNSELSNHSPNQASD
ncbi:hypothetical protein UlMin_029234 [Ulmus minor]